LRKHTCVCACEEGGIWQLLHYTYTHIMWVCRMQRAQTKCEKCDRFKHSDWLFNFSWIDFFFFFFKYFIYIFKLDRQTNRAQIQQLPIVTIMFKRNGSRKVVKTGTQSVYCNLNLSKCVRNGFQERKNVSIWVLMNRFLTRSKHASHLNAGNKLLCNCHAFVISVKSDYSHEVCHTMHT